MSAGPTLDTFAAFTRALDGHSGLVALLLTAAGGKLTISLEALSAYEKKGVVFVRSTGNGIELSVGREE